MVYLLYYCFSFLYFGVFSIFDGVVMDEDLVNRIKRKAIRKLSVDEKLRVLGSIMDAIMKIKVEIVKQRYNMTDEEAIRFLREKLIKLQGH